jgi:hypothetical protein
MIFVVIGVSNIFIHLIKKMNSKSVTVTVVVFFLLILFGFLYLDSNVEFTILQSDDISENREISKLSLFITYKSKEKVPEKVWNNLVKYAPEFQVRFFDDEQCKEYLAKHFNPLILKRYMTLRSGAHRADLWRYCALYREGGLYIDIKTILFGPLAKVLQDHQNLTVISAMKKSVYQGVLYCREPKNPTLQKAIYHIVGTSNLSLYSNYLKFTKELWRLIGSDSNTPPKPGQNGRWYLLREECTKEIPLDKQPDRYGFYCRIYDGDTHVIDTRYPEFPWD